MTTEVSALLAFVLGALCGFGQVGVASAAAVASLLLLALKDYLHQLARRVEIADIYATLKFALISVIILPLLPNETFGPPPIDVINPYKIWLMVVLIAGLNFVGYLLVKVLGNEHGIGLTGVLGGLVSSTAVTLSFSQRSRKEPAQSQAFVLAIVLAWTIMFVRVVVMTGVVYRPLAAPLGIALGMMTVAGLGVSLVLWRRSRSRPTGTVTTGANPFELGEAIKFGLLFGVVTVAAKAAEVYLGEGRLVSRRGRSGADRRRCDRALDGEPRRDEPREHDGGGAHDRDRGAREHGDQDRHGGVDGRTAAAPHSALHHGSAARLGDRRHRHRESMGAPNHRNRRFV